MMRPTTQANAHSYPMAMAVQRAELICARMVPMAAKHGAHSRLNAPKAAMAPMLGNMPAKAAHRLGSVSVPSAMCSSELAVATTFSLATRPVMDMAVACQESKPSGAKMNAMAPPSMASTE